MFKDGGTIIIPMLRQPHLLLQAICGIVRQSVYRHRIIVVYSDGPRMGAMNDCADWAVTERGEAYRFVDSVKRAERCVHAWGMADVTFLDCTTDLLAAGPQPYAAADGAWKSNYGLRHVTTEWVAPAWDADYYPLRGWDSSMASAMQQTGQHGVYVLRFLSPPAPAVVVQESLPDHPAIYPGWNGYLSCAALAAMTPGEDAVLTADEWADTSIGLNPQWWRRELLSGSVPMPELGKTPEWELSKLAQQMGLQRIAHGRSFILHKYSILGEAETVRG